jgi:hypothetical protein
LRRDDFNLELEGGRDEVSRLAEQSSRLEGVHARLRDGQTLVVQVSEDRSRADALAEILKLVDSAGLSLQTVHSGQNETENAYLQLLQEDQAHGFQRFDLETQNADDAVPGNPSA